MTAKEYLTRANNIDLEIDSLNISIQKVNVQLRLRVFFLICQRNIMVMYPIK